MYPMGYGDEYFLTFVRRYLYPGDVLIGELRRVGEGWKDGLVVLRVMNAVVVC